ncbi:15-cis-zeta-carotene isomerase chloroplastic-like, partial [Trifolium pratense]
MATSVLLSTSFSPTYYPSLSSSSSSISFTKPKLNLQRSSNFLCWNSKPLLSLSRRFITHSSIKEKDSTFIGEDSAAFDLKEQKISSWIYFTAILGVVLFILNVAWINNDTGFSKAFVDAVSSLSDSHETTALLPRLASGKASTLLASLVLACTKAYYVLFA